MDKILLRLLGTTFGKNIIAGVMILQFSLLLGISGAFVSYANRRDSEQKTLSEQLAATERRCAEMVDGIRKAQLEELKQALARQDALERKYKAKR